MPGPKLQDGTSGYHSPMTASRNSSMSRFTIRQPRMRAFWMLAVAWVPEMRAAARPKKVFLPVAYTTHSVSPCLIVEPEKATPPGKRFTGSDSPVRAAWSTCRWKGTHDLVPLLQLYMLISMGERQSLFPCRRHRPDRWIWMQ